MEVEVEEDVSRESAVTKEYATPANEDLKSGELLQDTFEDLNVLIANKIDQKSSSIQEDSNQEINLPVSKNIEEDNDYSDSSKEKSEINIQPDTLSLEDNDILSNEENNDKAKLEEEESVSEGETVKGLESNETQNNYESLIISEEELNEFPDHVIENKLPNNEKPFEKIDDGTIHTFPSSKNKSKDLVAKKSKLKINSIEKSGNNGKIKNVKDNIKNIIKTFNKEEEINDVHEMSNNEKKYNVPYYKYESNDEEEDTIENNERSSDDIETDTIKDLKNDIPMFENIQTSTSNIIDEREVKEDTLPIQQKSKKSYTKIKLRSKIREVKSKLEKNERLQEEKKKPQVEELNKFLSGGQKSKTIDKKTKFDYEEEEEDVLESEEFDTETPVYLEKKENEMTKINEEVTVKEMTGSDVKRSIEVKIPSRGIKVKITDGNVIEILETDSNEVTDSIKVKVTSAQKDSPSQSDDRVNIDKETPTQTKKKQKFKQSS